MKEVMGIRISDSEWKIMNLLWKNSPMSANEIIAQLGDADWSPRTVRSLISRLIKKEAIGYDQVRKEYFYYPILERHEYIQEEQESFLKKCYDSSVSLMVAQLLKEEQLSDDEIQQLKDLLNNERMTDD